MTRTDELRAVVASVPRGRVASYGSVGRAMGNPVSGLFVGRWMNNLADAPWWRIVGADGTLLIGRRDPRLAHDQRERLTSEGVRFDDQGRVSKEHFCEADPIGP